MKYDIYLLRCWLRWCLILFFAFVTKEFCYAGSQSIGTYYTDDTKIINYPQEIWGNGNKVIGATSSRSDLVEVVEQNSTSATIRVRKAVAGETVRVGITVDYADAHLNYKRETYLFTLYVKTIPIQMEESSIILNVGETYDLSYKSTIAGKRAPDASWFSSDRSVATVTQYGQVRAESEGIATITATTEDGETASCRITVRKVDPTDVTLPESLKVYDYSSATLTATPTPTYATTSYKWWSDDEDIAYLSGTGKSVTVYGKEAGETRVHVKTSNGHEDYCNIIVISTEPTGISIGKDMIAKYGKKIQLSAMLTPSYAKSSVTWSSSDISVAKVNNNGMVHCVGEGRATITAKTVRGGKQAKCVIVVAPQPTHFVLVMKSGERVAYSLGNNPRISCESDNVIVEDGDVRVEYPMSDVHKYAMGVGLDIESVNGDATPVKDVESDDKGMMEQKSGNLFINGFMPRSVVRIYTINGMLINEMHVGQEGYLEISLSNFISGAYIIKVNNKSFKFFKR